MEDVYFIDRDGNKVSAEGISSHIGLAFEILKHSKTFQEQFNKSGRRDPSDFLVYDLGYIKISEQLYCRNCVYLSPKISEKQKRILKSFALEGYELDDLIIKHLQDREI